MPGQGETGHDIVVVGGSAGSLSVLKTLLGALPAGLPASVFIVTHLPTGMRSTIPELLDRLSPLPVAAAHDGEAIVPGRVYVAPPGSHMLIVDGHVRLGFGPRENLSRPAIDPLFRSAAIAHGRRVVGVVLTGMLDDGSAGLAAIRRCGGLAVVQDPVDAEYDDMPRNAIATTSIDHLARADELSTLIVRLVGEAAAEPGPPVAHVVPRDLAIEVDIALGGRSDAVRTAEIADVVPMTCPTCSGALSEIRQHPPLRFRCQTGHAFSAKQLEREQEGAIDEALRVALRIIDERAELVTRLGMDASRAGRTGSSEMYGQRASEYRGYADTIRKAMLTHFTDMDIA